MRVPTLFEQRNIKSYFAQGNTEGIRYSCVRAVEQDNKLGGLQDTDHFLACLDLSNAIRLEIGLEIAPTVITAPANNNRMELGAEMYNPKPLKPVKQAETELVRDIHDIITDMGLPETQLEAMELTKRKLMKLIYSAPKSDIKSLGLPVKKENLTITAREIIGLIYP